MVLSSKDGLVVPGQVLTLATHDLTQPSGDLGVIHIVVVYPPLIAGVVGGIDIDAPDAATKPWKQRLERLQIVSADDHVPAAVVFLMRACLIMAVYTFQHAERDMPVMVDDFVFADPFQCGHGFLACVDDWVIADGSHDDKIMMESRICHLEDHNMKR